MRFAKALSEGGSPGIVVVFLPLAIAWHATGYRPWPTLGWGLLVALCCSALPMAFIVHGARRGRWETHHVRNREERFVPMLACLLCALGCLAGLLFGGAPRELIALLAAMLTVLVVAMVITRWWKISLHGAVASGAAAAVVAVYGLPYLALYAAVAVVCWSRVRLADHTLAQVIAGALLGPVAGGAVFLLLR
ncbi:hypothetical protein [Sciscionella sediminilitoris]|uniref:hypothetical protein n=1 Tax=Sciscionella sediminilitoris TaxID=1445613 RepID=UPI0004DEEEB7|nr:hypothetical protein [Sciscionella sp. SE31]